MSANMLRQMLAEAAAFLKDERFEQALDASRRVTQLDAGSFQGFMCVGLASQQLQQWDGAEQAFRRAAGLKPELPAPWKVRVSLDNIRGNYWNMGLMGSGSRASRTCSRRATSRRGNSRRSRSSWTFSTSKRGLGGT